MFGLFYGLAPIILILQGFCLYHAYRNGSLQRWLWLIVFIPLIGCLIYLYEHFYSRETVNVISETVKTTINRNYEVEQLEKQVKFSSTIQNKTLLADKYAEVGRTEEAIHLYEDCLQGFNSENRSLQMKLLECYAKNKQLDAAIDLGKKLKGEKLFEKSWARSVFAWCLYKTGQLAEAEENYRATNARYSNHAQRLELARFLHETERHEEALEILKEMLHEFDNMDGTERRHKRDARKAVEDYYKSIA